MRSTRDTQDIEHGLPGESATMRVPPRNRWQVLLIEYELLDAYWTQLHQRVWSSGLVLVGLTMLGIGLLSGGLDTGKVETQRVIGLIGGVAAVLSLGYFLLLQRLFTAQRVAEYRRDEVERELGMRSGLYLSFMRQSRLFGARGSARVAKRFAEGDEDLERELKEFASSPAAKSWLPQFLTDRMVWSLVPWILIGAWAALYVVKA